MDGAGTDTAAPLSSSIPRATRWLLVLVSAVTLMGALPGVGSKVRHGFALVPQATIGNFYLWNIVTAGFIEPEPSRAIVLLPCVVVFGRIVESAWGAREFVLFAVLVNAASGTVAFIVSMVVYFITRSQNSIFATIGGLSGLVGALTVAVKQLTPNRRLLSVHYGAPTNLLPFIFVVTASFVFVATAFSIADLGFVLGGVYFSWVYLRFFQRRGSEMGDTSEDFAFHTLFPYPLAPVVRVLGAVCFVFVRPCLPKQNSQSVGVQEKAVMQSSVVDAADAERRRQRALRVLDARLVDEHTDRVAQEV